MNAEKDVLDDGVIYVCTRRGCMFVMEWPEGELEDPGVPLPGVLALKDGTLVHGHDGAAVTMVAVKVWGS